MDLVSKEGKRKVSWRSKVADSAAGSLGRRPASGIYVWLSSEYTALKINEGKNCMTWASPILVILFELGEPWRMELLETLKLPSVPVMACIVSRNQSFTLGDAGPPGTL
ncbi:Zinc finger, ZZ type [Musa troglodytarum]|uniref:Zinc finger, ZZ type n=1 Tax=Musa troglodytarum TaxID=320322 RepID=A0A9E7ET08_9LILI|nr:Zinc finger, ZZ type [Musa troglodytarum]